MGEVRDIATGWLGTAREGVVKTYASRITPKTTLNDKPKA